jgi:hypothetical protein
MSRLSESHATPVCQVLIQEITLFPTELPEIEQKRKQMPSMLAQKDVRKSLQNNSKAFLLQHNDKIDVEKMVGNSK